MSTLHVLDWPKIRRDLGLVFSSQVAYKLVNYVVLMVLTRHFAKDQMGEFFFALSLAGSAVLLTELGMSTHLIRETARQPARAAELLGQVLWVRLPLFLLYFAGLALFAAAVRPELASTLLLIAVFVALEELYLSFGATFVGIRRVHYNVTTGIVARAALLAMVLGTVWRGGGLTAILGAYAISNALLVALAAWLAWSRVGPFPLRPPPDTRALLARSLPLFALTVLGTLHFRIDTLMLGFLRPYAEVATYEAAFKLLEAAQFLVRPLSMIFLPLCAELAVRGRGDALAALYRRMLLYAGGMGGALAVLVAALAGVVMPLVFGAAYASSAPVLRVLFLAVPAMYANIVGGLVARALDLERTAMMWMGLSVLLNVGLNVVTIPAWGPLGAAWSSVASQTLLAGLFLRLNLRRLARPFSAEAPAPPRPAEVARAL